MGYIDDTLKQAIMDEVITPNITDITIKALTAIVEEYKQNEASLDELRGNIVNTVMDISEPLITGMIEAYIKVYNDSVAAAQYQTRRDIEFLKLMMFNCRPMAVDGQMMHHTSQGLQEAYKDYITQYNEAVPALHKLLFPNGEPEGYINITAPLEKPDPKNEGQD